MPPKEKRPGCSRTFQQNGVDQRSSCATSTASSLYRTASRCQETTPNPILSRDGELPRIFAHGICEPTNPSGNACWGWIALDHFGRVMAHDQGCAGHGKGMSNVVAEYHAVIHALEWVRERKERASLLLSARPVVNQVTGEWLRTATHLVPLWERAIELVDETATPLILVPRRETQRAEALSRQAYEQARERDTP